MLVAATLFLAPAGRFDATVRFALPAGWNVVAPWAERAPGVYAPTATELGNDLIAVGRWTTRTADASGVAVTIVGAPGQERVVDVATPEIVAIVRAEIELFGVRPN